MPNDAFDQEAWLVRIGYVGPATFGLNLSDDELNTILAVRARHGVPGSSHPFFG